MKLYKLIILRLKAYFRKPTLLLALVGFLLLVWVILNFTNTNPKETFVLPIGVVDLDQTQYSQLIIQRISNKETISIKTTTEEESLKQVSTGKLEAVYILKEGLMANILDGNTEQIIDIVKSPVSLSAEIIGELFAAEVMRLASNVDAARYVVKQYGKNVKNKDMLWEEAWKRTDGYWEPSPVITIDYQSTLKEPTSDIKNQEITKIKRNISEILILTLLMFSILVASSPLLNEKNNGILKRITSTGTPLWIYLLSNVLTIMIIHAMGLLLITLFTGTINTLTSNLMLYIIYMIWASILGLIIVTLTKKMQQLLIIVPFITLCNSLLIWKFQVYNSFILDLFTK